MTINIGSARPAHIPGGGRQAARQARKATEQRNVILLIALVAAARRVFDRRTLRDVIVFVIGLVAASGVVKEHGTPGLDWYLAREREAAREVTHSLRMVHLGEPRRRGMLIPPRAGETEGEIPRGRGPA
jgi:tagatose-1,6-bisphosphate aldolase non-catalytic subunit AgaZ/GatZ